MIIFYFAGKAAREDIDVVFDTNPTWLIGPKPGERLAEITGNRLAQATANRGVGKRNIAIVGDISTE